MRRSLIIFITAASIGVTFPAFAQQVVPQPGANSAPAPVVNSYIPPGTPVSTPISPETPQTPGSSVIFVPQGTPAIVTPTTGLGYAPVATPIISGPPASQITRFADGTKVEIDSDNSVYRVYPDGARVAADDGIHKMMDGSTITLKDGKRVP